MELGDASHEYDALSDAAGVLDSEQLRHKTFDVLLQAAATPQGHTSQARQADEPGVAVNEPRAHAVHAEAPVTSELYVPSAHAEHEREDVAAATVL